MVITWETVLAVGGGIVLLENVFKVFANWTRPALNNKKRMEVVEEKVTRLEKHEKTDKEAIDHMLETNKLQCQAMLCIINHMIDGNNIVKMQETRDEIQDLLIKL